jgi:hypothetical protein
MTKPKTEEHPTKAGPPRRISVEARKAETRLINLEVARQNLVLKHSDEINALKAKRLEFIDSLPADVCGMLVAGGVITEEEVADARAGE